MSSIGKQLGRSINWPLVLVTILAFAAAYPLLSQPGLLNTRGGGDSPFLLQRLHQLETALRDGHFPVRWMPDANYGYGYPFFNYYAPLSIYIAAAFRLLGFSYVQAVHLAQLGGFLVAAWGMYHLARRWWASEWAGVLAAAAYTFAPFHLVNIYVRGDSLAEFWAMAFYPWVFLAAERLVSSSEFRVSSFELPAPKRLLPTLSTQHSALSTQSIIFALSYAALILSHNISALIFTPFLLLYLLFRIAYSPHNPTHHAPRTTLRLTHHLPHLTFALFLALALSAWFWLPALGEQDLAQLGPVTEGYFHYSNHFRGRDLIQPSFLFNYDITPGSDPFRMGLAQTGLIGLSLIILFTQMISTRRTTHHAPRLPAILLPLILFLIATFMITPASQLLWDHLPLLPFTQFPWRFLSVQAFAAALVIGVLGRGNSGELGGTQGNSAKVPTSSFKFLRVPILLLLLTYTALGNLYPDHLLVTDADVTAERLAEYEWFTGNIGSTVSAEYLPEWVRPRPFSSDWLVTGNRDRATVWGTADATLLERTTDQQTWHITIPPDETTRIMLPTLYWPGWQAELANGTGVALQPADGSGLIQLTLPGGDHDLTLRLTRTPLRLGAEFVSLAAALFILVVFGTRIYTDWHGFKTALAQHATRNTLLLIILIFIAILRSSPSPNDNQTWDFAQMGYLHPADEVWFDNGVTLERYEYGAVETTTGTDWSLTLWLSGVNEAVAGTIWLTTPAINRFAAAPPLASLTQPLQNGPNSFTFTLPENAPVGLYVPRLTIGNAAALTLSNQPRGDLFLRPFRLTNENNTPVSEGDLNVHVVAVQCQVTSNQLSVTSDCDENCSLVTAHCSLTLQLAWYTATPLSQNLAVSLLLTQPNGEWLEQFDTQPGYGFLPSTSWPANTWVNDWLSIPLPDEAPPYTLVVRLYEADGAIRLTRRLGVISQSGDEWVFQASQPSYTLPEGIVEMNVRLGDAAALRGYALTQTDTTLNVTLVWESLTPDSTDYRHFIHLIDPATGEIIAQHDAMPVNNSYPTSQWTTGEIVTDAAALPLETIPPGNYQLVTGLYFAAADGSFPRLPAQNPDGSRWPDQAIPLRSILIP